LQVQLLRSDPAGSKGKAAAAADGKLTFKGAATRAGSYILQVLVDSRPVSGWTRVLQVRLPSHRPLAVCAIHPTAERPRSPFIRPLTGCDRSLAVSAIHPTAH
jgi:hypothetical protein